MWARIIPACVLAAVAATAFAASMTGTAAKPVFRPVSWQLPIDPWGPGQAFQCSGGACGAEVRLYARTKTGFCNCFGGVADDDEIDRIGDVDLHGDDFAGTAPGRVTELGGMQGRARGFRASLNQGGTRQVVSIVVASDCKAVVATLVSDREIPAEVEQSARNLLAAAPFQHWVAAQ
jgi:hypothetical protein